MVDSQDQQTQDTESLSTSVHPARFVVFAAMSAGFLVWVTLGQVEARVWVSGQLTLLDRHISSIWRYLGQNLPELPAPGLVSMAYWLSITTIVVGTVAGLWLFLGTSDTDSNAESIDIIQADHIHHEVE